MPKKSVEGRIQPIKKSKSNLVLAIIIIILLLLVLFVLAYLTYDYYRNKIPPTTNQANQTNVNNTTPVNGSDINDTSRPKNDVCGDGRCTGKENVTNCAKDCKTTGPGGGGDNTCTPTCAWKQCGNNGCGGICGSCNTGYACNSTFGCSLIDCTNETGCNIKGQYCSGNIPYNCTNTDEDICLERVNSDACASGFLCANSTGCYESRNCTSNNNCTYLNNITCDGNTLRNNTGVCSNFSCITNSSTIRNCDASASYLCDSTNRYKNDYSCSGNQCVNQSVFDKDCNDTSFCNGAETCWQGVCGSGTLPDCNDHIGCTVDSCNELEKCNHAANNSLCPPTQFCDITQGCVDNPVCLGTDDSCGIYPSCSNCSLSDNCYGTE